MEENLSPAFLIGLMFGTAIASLLVSPTAVLTHLAVLPAVFDSGRPWPDAGAVVSIQTSATPVLPA